MSFPVTFGDLKKSLSRLYDKVYYLCRDIQQINEINLNRVIKIV